MIDFKFQNIQILQKITEYDFYLINLIGKTKEGLDEHLFIKTIKKGKIKESLFCIYDLFYDKYHSTDEKVKKNEKISIIEEKNDKNLNKISLNIYQRDENKNKYSIEINFIEISDILKKFNLKGDEIGIELDHKKIIVAGREKMSDIT